jgi:heme A synthase
MIGAGFPRWIATAHNAGAALLLLATVALYDAVGGRPVSPGLHG